MERPDSSAQAPYNDAAAAAAAAAAVAVELEAGRERNGGVGMPPPAARGGGGGGLLHGWTSQGGVLETESNDMSDPMDSEDATTVGCVESPVARRGHGAEGAGGVLGGRERVGQAASSAIKRKRGCRGADDGDGDGASGGAYDEERTANMIAWEAERERSYAELAAEKTRCVFVVTVAVAAVAAATVVIVAVPTVLVKTVLLFVGVGVVANSPSPHPYLFFVLYLHVLLCVP